MSFFTFTVGLYPISDTSSAIFKQTTPDVSKRLHNFAFGLVSFPYLLSHSLKLIRDSLYSFSYLTLIGNQTLGKTHFVHGTKRETEVRWSFQKPKRPKQ